MPEFQSGIKLEVVVPDSLEKEIVDDIIGTLTAGSHAVGKIFVKEVPRAYDISTKASGESAL